MSNFADTNLATNDPNNDNERVESILDQITVTPNALCMNCGGTGTSRVLPTTIPYFREVAVCFFKCDDCGFKNSEVMDTSIVQEQGIITELTVTNSTDMNLQVIKSNTASVQLPELDFEIPHTTQRGVMSTVEGIIRTALDNLKEFQEERRKVDPTTAEKLDAFMAQLTMYAAGVQFPFTFILRDPAGNSHIQNPAAPLEYEYLKLSYFNRTVEESKLCGLRSEAEKITSDENMKKISNKILNGDDDNNNNNNNNNIGTTERHKLDQSTKVSASFDIHDQSKKRMGWLSFSEKMSEYINNDSVTRFETPCQNCDQDGELKTCQTDIPFFKEVVIMAFSCENCGFRSNEIKAGGAVPEKGTVHTLTITGKDPTDMHRDILKSSTASISIPELDFFMAPGSLGGIYTTVEGLLKQIHDKLFSANPFAYGDSADTEEKENFKIFLQKLIDYQQGTEAFKLILKDPMGNSFIYSPTIDGYKDDDLITEEYERSYEENDELGLNDMNTEGNYWERETNDNRYVKKEEEEDVVENEEPSALVEEDKNAIFVQMKENMEKNKFISSPGFDGKKDNMIFKTGALGTGYYIDNFYDATTKSNKNMDVELDGVD